MRYFEELYRRLKPPFFIVLDDYQEVSPDAEFHDVIVHGLCNAPRGITVIVISRNEPPPPFIRLRANDKIHFIGWDEIRFTVGECGEFVRRKKQNDISAEVICQLHERTQGWIAGIVLLMDAAKTKNIRYHLPGKLTPQEIFDYFAREVFSKADEKTQSFLLKTAFLTGMTPEITERLTGLSASERILSSLSRNNWFTTVRTAQETFYQYHPLFREFLLARAKAFFSPDELFQLQRNASALMEESGLVEDAVSLLLDAGDFEGMVRLIINQAQSLVAQGRNKTLEGWIGGVPDEIFKKNPWLIYWMGVCKLPFDPAEGRRCFEDAFHLFRARGDWAGILLAWSGVVETFVHEFEHLLPLGKWIALYEEFLKQGFTFPSQEIKTRVTASRFVAMVLRQPHHADIAAHASLALSFSEKYQQKFLRMQTMFYLSMYYIWTGNLRETGVVVNKLYDEAQSGEAPPLVKILGKSMKAMHEWLTGAAGSGIDIIRDALKLSGETGICQWDIHLLSQGACAALSAGDMKTAEDMLRQATGKLAIARKVDRGFYYYADAWHALLCGSLPSALEHIKLSVTFVAEVDVHFPDAINRLLMAQVLFELGEYREAVTELNHACRIGRRMKSRLIEFLYLVAKAQFSLGVKTGDAHSDEKRGEQHDRKRQNTREDIDGDEKRGLDTLRKAFALGREQGYGNMFGWRPGIMAKLCAKALNAGIEVAYVRDLIRRSRLVPVGPLTDCDDWPWRLKIYTLGRFEIQRDGNLVIFSGKIQKKPLLLLKAVIAGGGSERMSGQMSDMLWPKADSDTAFRTTLHRLRLLLGDERVLRVQGGRVTIDTRHCWIDVLAFEQISQQMTTMVETHCHASPPPPPSGNPNRIPNLVQKSHRKAQAERLIARAKELYLNQGVFLPDDSEYQWVKTARERLRNTMNDMVRLTRRLIE